jgi:ABC-2 type transport system permease protein
MADNPIYPEASSGMLPCSASGMTSSPVPGMRCVPAPGTKTGAIRQIFRLWLLYGRMDLLWLLRDTRTGLMTIVSDIIGSAAGISGVILLSVRFGGIGGMSSDEVLFMLGYATCIDGVFMLFFNMCNVAQISRIIGRGQLDHMLVQPVPLWMQLLTSGFIPFTGSSLMLCGLGLTGWSAARLGLWSHPWWIVWMAVNLPASVAVVMAMSYLAGSSAFYAPVAAEEISSSSFGFFDALKRFPLGGLPRPIQLVLCTVLPAGLVAWFPMMTLLHSPPAGLPVFFLILFALAITTLATYVFRKGFAHYAKNGSIRYSDHGFRR